MARRVGLVALPLATFAALGLLWQAGTWALGARTPIAGEFGPWPACLALVRLLADGEILMHAATTLRRIAVGLAIALAVGVPLGLAVGLSPRFAHATTPLFQLLRMVSPLSWMPLAVIALGIGDAPVHFLLAYAAVWPILLNTAAGVTALDGEWLQLARSLAATRRETLRHVILPGIAPQVLTGIRLAIGLLWIVVVPAEMLGVSAGLGYFVLDARDRLAYPELMAAIVLIGGLGWALDAVARAVFVRG
ncbi:MAG: ABC transporter permease [Burkholderiales bacterium]|jgi:NitT/TauT family transport system permease protein